MNTAPEYDAIHSRLRVTRGSATAQPCSVTGCDQQAGNWAWNRTGPSRSGVRYGEAVTWGTDLDTYVPMCRSHHSMLDRGGTLTHCPRGHDRAVYGSTSRGTCRGCKADGLRNRRAARRAERSAV